MSKAARSTKVRGGLQNWRRCWCSYVFALFPKWIVTSASEGVSSAPGKPSICVKNPHNRGLAIQLVLLECGHEWNCSTITVSSCTAGSVWHYSSFLDTNRRLSAERPEGWLVMLSRLSAFHMKLKDWHAHSRVWLPGVESYAEVFSLRSCTSVIKTLFAFLPRFMLLTQTGSPGVALRSSLTQVSVGQSNGSPTCPLLITSPEALHMAATFSCCLVLPSGGSRDTQHSSLSECNLSVLSYFLSSSSITTSN